MHLTNKIHYMVNIKLVLDNKQQILELIEKGNVNESNEVHDFYEFGILLLKIIFWKKLCIIKW